LKNSIGKIISLGLPQLNLIVYVDDTVIPGHDANGISQLKEHLCKDFQFKDLGGLKYFLGIEVA